MTDEPEIQSPRVARKAGKRTPPAPSRGRPAAGPVAQAASGEGDSTKQLTRRSRRDGSGSDFEIPAHLKKPGWDYEYKTIAVMGQPVDAAEMQRVYEGGWRPVNSKDMPQLCPPGWKKPTIERYGQMLFTRPMRLTQEARQEDIELADKQKNDKLKGAMVAGPTEDSRLTRRIVTEFSIEGEVGVHDQRPAA